MPSKPCLVRAVVVRGDDQTGIGPVIGCGLGQLDRMTGVVGSAAKDYSHLSADLGQDSVEQGQFLIVIESR